MDGPIPAPVADPLGEALHLLRMNGAFYCRSELRAPWGLELPALPGYLWFHVVTAGSMRLEAGDAVRTLGPGEVALVPRGEGHVLRSEPGVAAPGILDLPREQVSERYEILRVDGDGPAATLLCGAVRFGHPAAASFVGVLPEIIHLVGIERLQATLSLMAAEAREPRLGGEAVITRLADILVIQALRAWLETDPGARTGWLGALQDEQIGRAIALIHRDPARDWTVESLAHRGVLVAQGGDRDLHPPPRDVGDRGLAGRLGYRSEAAFARAFKRETGMPPGAVRRLPDALEALAPAA